MENGSFNSTGSTEKYSTISTIILPTIFYVVSFVGLVGNTGVIYIMATSVRQRNNNNSIHVGVKVYVTNLAMADLLFIMMLPLWATDMVLKNKWPFGETMCRVTSGLTYLHMYASIYFLTCMAIHRFVAVVFHLKAVNRSISRAKKEAKLASATVWLISIVMSSVVGVYRELKSEEQDGIVTYVCTWAENEPVLLLLYFITRSILGFLCPMITIASCYLGIAVFLNCRTNTANSSTKIQDKATTVVIVIIVIFLLCWLPNQISNLLYIIQEFGWMTAPTSPSAIHYYIHVFSLIPAWGHSCVNPFIYAFMTEGSRRTIKEFFFPCGRQLASPNHDPTRKTVTTKLCQNPVPLTQLISGKKETENDENLQGNSHMTMCVTST